MGGTWRAVPFSVGPFVFIYRTDWFQETVGSAKFPETIDALIDASRKLKAARRPAGQALGHSFGDPPGWAYPWLWAHGGKEVTPDGRTVAIDTPESALSVEKAVEWFKSGVVDAALSWDDPANNRAYLGEAISLTLNGTSIYNTARRERPQLVAVSEHGVSRTRAFLEIVVPLAPPGLLSVAIFSFTLSWNEYLYALVFISDSATKTVPVGVTSELIRGDYFFWGSLMAAALAGSIPVALVHAFFVEYFVEGLTAGAVKG